MSKRPIRRGTRPLNPNAPHGRGYDGPQGPAAVDADAAGIQDPANSLFNKLLTGSEFKTGTELLHPQRSDDPVSLAASGGFGGSGTNSSSFISMLESLLKPTSGSTDDENKDWNKEVRDLLLQFLLQQENRAYNEKLLKDQRQYDSPTAQLLRLMSTGMSRDAALQYLSGGGSGSSGVPYSDLMQLPSSAISASESNKNGVETRAAVANAVFNGVSTLLSCCNVGMGVAQGIQVIKSLSMQNFMDSEKLRSYNGVRSLASGLQHLASQNPDFDKTLGSFSNAQDLYNYLQDNRNNELISPLYSSGLVDDVFGTPYGRSMFNDYWSSIRNTRDSGTILDNYLRKQDLDNAVTNMQVEKIGAELQNIGKQNNEIDQRIAESCARVVQMQYQNELFEQQTDLTFEQTRSAAAQAGIDENTFRLNDAGFPMLKDAFLNELRYKMTYWATITDPKQLEYDIDTWTNEPRNRAAAMYIETISNEAAGSWMDEHPFLARLCSGWRAVTGGKSVIDDAQKVTGVAGTVVKIIDTVSKL